MIQYNVTTKLAEKNDRTSTQLPLLGTQLQKKYVYQTYQKK